MPLFVTLTLAASFAGLFIGWALLERRESKPRVWLGIVATGLAIPIAYFAGVFASSFNDNLCYSEVITELQAAHATGRVVAVTLSGYETSCRLVLAQIKQK
jgi:NO-binding membrane sensor protein with MHYT domain